MCAVRNGTQARGTWLTLFILLHFLEVRNGEEEVEMTLLLVMLAVDKAVCWVIVNV